MKSTGGYVPQSDEHFDFFVSYARDDNANGWITRFIEDLQAEHQQFAAGRNLKPFIDKNAIPSGADWQHSLTHGVTHSHLFIAFISPNYFASEWCRREWRAWIDTEIAQHIFTAGVRPVYIVEVPGLTGKGQFSDNEVAQNIAQLFSQADCDRNKFLAETPPVVNHLRRRQFTDVQPFFDTGLDALRKEDLRKILDQMAHDIDNHSKLLEKAANSFSTVDPYNSNFTGRFEELVSLRDKLLTDNRTGVIYGIHGLGGIGKTELALTYAHAFGSAYPGGRFLIRCEGKPTLREAMLCQHNFTGLFNKNISDEQRLLPETYFAALLACLQERLDQRGHILLVLDNITDITLLSPEQSDEITKLGSNLHVLATTRVAPPSGVTGNWLSLDSLRDEDALELLEKHRPFATDAERDAAKSIVKRLGGFALAVELVAARLAARESANYGMLADVLALDDLEEIAGSGAVVLRRHNHEQRLSAVLGPVLECLKPAERRTLEYAALLPPDQVLLPWLQTLVAADFPEIGRPARLSNPWSDLWQQLEKLSLFSRTEKGANETRIVKVHRLVQDLVKRDMTDENRDVCQTAVEGVVRERVTVIKKSIQRDDGCWELEPLGALARLWADNELPQAASLLSFVGNCWSDLAEWAEAEPLYRRALAIDEQKLGPDHPVVAKRINNLARLLQATNRLTDAESLYYRALGIDEHHYGSEDPHFATDLGNIASLLVTSNRLPEAEMLMHLALTILNQYFEEPDHPKKAGALSRLALLYQATDRLADSEPLHRRVLAIYEKNYDPNHPNVAIGLNNLALLLKLTNRNEEAEPLYHRALMIQEKRYGTSHPRVALGLNNLAKLYKETNRPEEAERLYRRALAIDEQRYAPEHPSIARDLYNLAELLQASNRLEEAEPLMHRAVEIYAHFFRMNSHQHKHWEKVKDSYEKLCNAMNESRE